MHEHELLTRITCAMLEFTNEKKNNPSFSGRSIYIRFENPNVKTGSAILDKYNIEDMAEKILNIDVEFNLIVRVQKSLFETYYGKDKMLNLYTSSTYFNGKEFVEKIKVLIETTQTTVKQATHSVLEIYYAETLLKTIDFLKNIQLKVDAGETQF